MSLKINQLPNSERPYEKLEMYGEKNLSNSELLSIIIKTGTKEETALELAKRILTINKIDTNSKLRFLQDISIEELKTIKGIGRVKAIQIKAVAEIAKRMATPLDLCITIKQTSDIANLLMEELRYEKREILKLILLNQKCKIVKIIDISIGTSNVSPVYIKEILREAIKEGVPKIILVHNHPSGDAMPSVQDIEVTKKIKEASRMVDIDLIDHIVIGDGTYESIMKRTKAKV